MEDGINEWHRSRNGLYPDEKPYSIRRMDLGTFDRPAISAVSTIDAHDSTSLMFLFRRVGEWISFGRVFCAIL